MPSPRQVYDHPLEFREHFTKTSDDQFEGQHFERKEVRQIDEARKGVIKTISAFANSNVEGGLLVLGISSDGTITGIDHLSEKEKNSLTNFHTLLHHQTALAKEYKFDDHSGEEKTIVIIFVPYSKDGICETLGKRQEAWIRSGPQISL